jgi:hypothetical protein
LITSAGPEENPVAWLKSDAVHFAQRPPSRCRCETAVRVLPHQAVDVVGSSMRCGDGGQKCPKAEPGPQ